jgi:gag-polypeptide of LTR copia-type
MDNTREGGSINRPPVLDGSNYGYWKARMCAFMKSLDNKTWKAVLNGWNAPQLSDSDGNPIGPKPEKDWTDDEDEESLGNSRALNAIFNGVDKNVFRLINTCTTAKSAWDILAVAYEGTTKVREQKLQYLTTNFEALVMKEDE